MRFRDRRDAGRALARELTRFVGEAPVVLALPRGGVVVAAEVAAALHAPLDVIVVRKIPAPRSPELALGAVCEMGGEQVHLDPRTVRETGAPEAYLRAESQRQLDEVRRREALYRAGRPAVPIAGRTTIIVDDGVATGS
ncbi:MAG TPA: phosphoribosyltransferase family protein, partial [Phycisphaerales bacterium]|nr:phosphoribosyltransferase family protein [Phycisphaerales bacterium]